MKGLSAAHGEIGTASSYVSLSPSALEKNKTHITLKISSLIRILNCGPARVDVAVDSGVEGASWDEVYILVLFYGGDSSSVEPSGQAPSLGLPGLELVL